VNEAVVAVFVPIVSMIVIGLVLIAYFYFRYRGRQQLQETVRQAIDKGSELSPELIERLAGPKESPDQDLRKAGIWLAVGIGFVLFGITLGEEDAVRPLVAVGTFPTLIGVAYLVMWKFTSRGA